MRTWSILVAVVVLAISTSLVMAQQKGGGQGNRVRGKITKIDGANITVQPAARGDAAAPEAKTFATNDKTAVTAETRDGAKKAVSDLKVDDTVAVTLSEDGKTATAIIINPPARTGKGGNKGG